MEKAITMLHDFQTKLDTAYEARRKLLNYLEDMYDFDLYNDLEVLELSDHFVFDINEDTMMDLIRERRNPF